jgi:hypothetical protein
MPHGVLYLHILQSFYPKSTVRKHQALMKLILLKRLIVFCFKYPALFDLIQSFLFDKFP